jgi:hypothetical protein
MLQAGAPLDVALCPQQRRLPAIVLLLPHLLFVPPAYLKHAKPAALERLTDKCVHCLEHYVLCCQPVAHGWATATCFDCAGIR